MILSPILHNVDPGSHWVSGMSLHMFTNRLGEFIRENHIPAEDISLEVPFPIELRELREAVGHHLIPLLLIARSDRNIAPEECEIIVQHGLDTAARHGIVNDEKHSKALREYVATFRPALSQLDPAIAHLAYGDHEDFVALVDAARNVVMCDGVSRPEEAKFLALLRNELAGQQPQA